MYHLYTLLGDLRTKQLFDIIVSYPEARPSILDLKLCLEKTNRRRETLLALIKSFQQRLLLPGTNTDDILEMYLLVENRLIVLDMYQLQEH